MSKIAVSVDKKNPRHHLAAHWNLAPCKTKWGVTIKAEIVKRKEEYILRSEKEENTFIDFTM